MEPWSVARRTYRLHCADGPALEYPDGWKVYSWHGLRVPERIILSPETLTSAEVMSEPNAEMARVMIERMGMERFMAESKAKVLDSDVDGAGQPRRLLSVPAPQGSPHQRMLAVHVTCPSTGHEYMLAVPPQTKSCAEGVAWTFNCKTEEYVMTAEQ